MPQLWQCDVCGAQYRVGWLSHCYRCEGRPPKPRKAVEKPARRKRMPRIVAGVGPSNARADLEAQPEPEPVVEPVEDVTEPEFDAMWAEGTPVEVVTEPVEAPVEATMMFVGEPGPELVQMPSGAPVKAPEPPVDGAQ